MFQKAADGQWRIARYSFSHHQPAALSGDAHDHEDDESSGHTQAATAMGGMGRQFDGGYAEYTCVPAAQVQAINTTLDWQTFGALPEMIQTAWGSLTSALRLQAGQSLLIRGGTTSVGLAAAVLAKQQGATVAAPTRKADRQALLEDNAAGGKIVVLT